jgi:hypothetical protein
MESTKGLINRTLNRRSLLQKGMMAAGAATVGAVLSGGEKLAFGQSTGGSLTNGDIAILRFLAAAEIIESDLWIQYAELGGLTPGQEPPEVNPNEQPMNNYQAALLNLDGDGPQYISSNTLDEISHEKFLNAYLQSKGAEPVDLEKFRTLEGSQATGARRDRPRLTNLMHLNVDTSWYVRYRSKTNPEFGATYPQAITLDGVTAIPRTDADFDGAPFPNGNPNGLGGNLHTQAIANVAAFHFGFIEQGGSSLYQTLSQKVSSLEALKITMAIGGDEVAHFLEWVDFSGNGVQAPVAPFTDPTSGLMFPNFFSPLNPSIQPSLIFPVPCEFISPNLPHCAVIRPTSDQFSGAQAAVAAFTNDNLFFGQSPLFFQTLKQLAEAADAATREL